MSRKDFELDMDKKQMKALMKRAKRKQLLRNWIISICSSVVVIVGLFLGTTYFSQQTFERMEREVNALHMVQGPNIRFSGTLSLSNGMSGRTVMYSSYKNIEGQPVKWVDEMYESGLWNYRMKHYNGDLVRLDEEEVNKEGEAVTLPDYNVQTMQREMRFYLPFVTYKNYVNDLNNIGELQNKVAEVGLSFDKAYTAEQVVEMLPKDIQPVWFWADTYNDKKADTYVGLKDPKSGAVLNAEMAINVFGFEGSYAKVQENIKNDLTRNSKEFLYQMKYLAENSEGIPNDYFDKYYKEIKNTPPKDLPIYGVVVTGKTEELQQLQGAPYIKAAVRGVTVEKQ
ncbi:anti sigma factor C-terminal domain-containing protein [Bacillus sp. DX4.1]|uniref:anti sigma factor C-terminal domain-containing protein n=1 Tax=Bacillus sp. DX4.1 TaxID=3055867 RepID=UPI0025A1F959|nr:anti sigma factor C-terminal domain-containing protein [Bacillus sp. DX4.1]MDM5190296.1 anti sigma factor C-terminal domain-containing protein [Bacillus sp. DX4.1]